MQNLSTAERCYIRMRTNRWYRYFSIFCRMALAIGFLPAGMVKIAGERFANGLSVKHPMGAYLEALSHTGFYYTFIGVAQVVAAVLLLIPGTAVLGAIIYLPIIINIWLLSVAVRFEGSFVTAPLMVFANLYILAWNYGRIQHILPFRKIPDCDIVSGPGKAGNEFPYLFFAGVLAVVGLTAAIARFGFDVMPRNSLSDCKKQFAGTRNEAAGFEFCDCIHRAGKPLNQCLLTFEKSKKEAGK